jgi:hypothetical protein
MEIPVFGKAITNSLTDKLKTCKFYLIRKSFFKKTRERRGEISAPSICHVAICEGKHEKLKLHFVNKAKTKERNTFKCGERKRERKRRKKLGKGKYKFDVVNRYLLQRLKVLVILKLTSE